jgi:DNA-binding GntR family transcriptional regulator
MTVAPSKLERTYALLRARILEGVYGPGHRLVIDALARELEVSQMPVREAIRRLEAEGWATYQRNQGFQVAPIDAVSWTEATATLAVLEGYATALAAPYVEAGDLVRMAELNALMLAAIEDLDVLAISKRNQAFHQVIYDRCPNEHLRRELQGIQERLNTLRSSIFMFIPTRGRASLAEHEELMERIEGGADPLEIEMLAREHKMHTVAAYQQRLNDEERS